MTPLNTDKATSNIGPSETPADIDANNFAQLFKATIMMIDDESINIEVTKEFMEESGYHNFVSTSEPRDALNLIETERPDIILLDLTMPHFSGFDILNAMRKSKNKMRYIPVIVLTSSDDPEIKLKALELGATDFLAKPVDSSELV